MAGGAAMEKKQGDLPVRCRVQAPSRLLHLLGGITCQFAAFAHSACAPPVTLLQSNLTIKTRRPAGQQEEAAVQQLLMASCHCEIMPVTPTYANES